MDLSEPEKKRYSRQLQLKGFEKTAQLKLKSSSVLVIGAGGLGCPCLLYLNAAGVGQIGIIDDDKVSLSNLQRQTLYNEQDVGGLKAEIARLKLLEKNSGTDITAYPVRLTSQNAAEIINLYDVMVDATDNFFTRYLVNDICLTAGKPLIYGALFEFEGHVTTFNYKNGPNLNDLFPVNASDDDINNCNNTGVLGVLPGIIGTWQALEAIKVITGVGKVLSGKLMLFNALTNEIDLLNFEHSNQPKKPVQPAALVPNTQEIDWNLLEEWKKDKSIQLVDVREEHEFEECNIGGINLPLPLLDKRLNEINDQRQTVVICLTGSRSKKGVEIIKVRYPDIDIYHLNKGLSGAGLTY